MIELKRDSVSSQAPRDLESLQQRATARRHRHRQFSYSVTQVRTAIAPLLVSPFHTLRSLPARYLLHTVVILFVPLALLLSHLPSQPVAQPIAPSRSLGDTPIGLGPINLDTNMAEQGIVGDPPLEADDSMPMPMSLVSRSQALAPLIIPASISGDLVKLRNGPSLEYDEVARLKGGTSVQVIGRFGDWLQVREGEGKPVYWVAGELVNIPEASVFTLFEVSKEAIPPPPPPKVGTVREAKLNLRDGPGTNYVTMKGLQGGDQLTLIEQYQDWLYVASGDLTGWVKTEFLDIGPNVLNRVPVAEAIPDPNPALVGQLNENKVNLRKGPGSAYERVGTANAGAQVSLLARHKDWYQVRLDNGTKAWIFSDLLNVSAMVQRRVPVTNNIPALPVRTRVAAAPRSSGLRPSDNLAAIPASGDVAGFAVQFVGYRYVYGGASPSRGFDCSGLMHYVYRQFGVSLPRTAASQYNTAYGAAVGDMSNLQPGDLMFFVRTARGGGITHVAMYVGGGRMVHAMTPSLGVQVSNIWEGYWTSRYIGGLRVNR